MTDQILNILKFALLGLLYLFFARVLWAVWSEVRTPKQHAIQAAPAQQRRDGAPPAQQQPAQQQPAQQRSGQQRSGQQRPAQKPRKAQKGRSGRVGRLVILEPRARRGTAVAMHGEITLGRDPSCSFAIDDDSFISQLHFRIYDYEGQPMLEDLGSTNGTFHNGNKVVGAKLLHPGDRIQVGTTVIEAQ
ncbi:MAG: FHA domain-containing protein [Ilumatobacter sp.]|jgi:pSer/pThr/pTyr-binding forkhead associated (FHA) protein|uniref:FHA domain-containing protein n=1 Tax=uncultured Ilumatobacter sp. TaxID=879968 RepID=UPI003591513F|tara:strand:+ start:340 stop:906 length:567 start_codon:yes stop_codon:yes gene_type:complete